MNELAKYHNIKSIIFDLDGVLVDSRHLHYEALNAALEEVGSQFVIGVEEHLAKYDGLPTNKKLALLTQKKGLPTGFHTQVWRRKQDLTISLIHEMIKKDDRLIKILRDLKSSGYHLYCASNSILSTLTEMLKALGVLKLFDRIYSNEDVIYPKPMPTIYLKCFVDNGLVPCQCLVVEDSPIGRVAASLSGAHVCPVASPSGVNIDVIMKAIREGESVNKKMSIDTRWLSDIQVVIPMAGLGSRFAVAGYVDPKPLIDIDGKPMIQWVVENFNIPGAKFVFVLRKEHVELFEDVLGRVAPGCSIVTVDELTAGPACTVLHGINEAKLDMSKPLLIANSDQWLEWDPNAFLYCASSVDGCISVFNMPKELGDKKWSYAAVGEDGMVERVAEKEVISSWATTGIYYWSRTGDFVKYVGEMIDDNERVNGEFYCCPIYNRAIVDGKKIKVVECRKMWGLGVPDDLEKFKREYLGLL